jgi:galactokinase
VTSTAEPLAQAFAETYVGDPSTAWRAPGRVNLIGEHTDYNGGLVLPFAIGYDVRVAARPRPGGLLRIASRQEPGEVVEVGLADLAPGAVTGWAAYVAGTAWALAEHGHVLVGADLLVDGDVPQGGGMSSSAALECSSACALLTVAGHGWDPMQVALAAQRAENDFVGMPCGIMDQAAAMLSRAGHALQLDCATLDSRPVPLDPGGEGLALLVVDTRAPHRLVDGEYAARRTACEQAAGVLGVPHLGQLNLSDLDEALASLPDAVLRRRTRHVVTEVARVREVVALLDAGDLAAVGPVLDASHASLRDDFEVTVPELDAAVEAVRAAGALGARMTGGGFGGSIVALVPADDVTVVADAVAEAFARRGFAAPVSRPMSPSDGAGPLAVV